MDRMYGAQPLGRRRSKRRYCSKCIRSRTFYRRSRISSRRRSHRLHGGADRRRSNRAPDYDHEGFWINCAVFDAILCSDDCRTRRRNEGRHPQASVACRRIRCRTLDGCHAPGNRGTPGHKSPGSLRPDRVVRAWSGLRHRRSKRSLYQRRSFSGGSRRPSDT